MSSMTLDQQKPKQPQPNHVDRLTFTIFLAAAFHALIIFGLTFGVSKDTTPKKQLSVVLAERTDKTGENADFLGQSNQQGGGEKVEATTASEFAALFDADSVQQTQQSPNLTAEMHQDSFSILTSRESSFTIKLLDNSKYQPQQLLGTPGDEFTPQQEIASLKAELDQHRIAQANNPKIRTISASIHQSQDAAYLDAWRKRIEKIGNLNYPEIAKQRKLYGSLLMSVAINPDGTIYAVKVERSSGHKILDDAAIRIVRLAAPFAPFSADMRQDTDILEIVRLWKFLPDNTLNAQ